MTLTKAFLAKSVQIQLYNQFKGQPFFEHPSDAHHTSVTIFGVEIDDRGIPRRTV